MIKKNLYIFFLIIISCCLSTFGQNTSQTNKSNETVLLPLTEEQKKINPKDIVRDQPDFMAEELYFSARAISAFSVQRKIARKGKQYRVDTGFVVVITELGKPFIKINGDKTFEKSVADYKAFVNPTSPLNPTDLLGFNDVAFTMLGTIEVDGNKLLKIEAKSKEFDEEIFLYADPGKKNLITIIQVIGKERSGIQRLNNISFDVSTNLFDLSGNRELPKYNWEKVKTAKVFSDGKLVEGAVVFRREQYIFIHVREFNHMLIDLNKNIADTVVFQGLLVAKNGAPVWRTSEDSAISTGELDGYFKSDCTNCVEIKNESNTLTIPDPDNKKKFLIKVTL